MGLSIQLQGLQYSIPKPLVWTENMAVYVMAFGDKYKLAFSVLYVVDKQVSR